MAEKVMELEKQVEEAKKKDDTIWELEAKAKDVTELALEFEKISKKNDNMRQTVDNLIVSTIPGDGVKTGVINSWDKGDGKKCTNVGLGDCRHMGSLPSCCFTKMWDRRRVF